MIYLDIYESDNLASYLSRQLEVVRRPLNSMGLADIWWVDIYADTHQIEHKSVNEILDNQDAIEEQLSRQYPNAKHNYLLVRDLAVPNKRGGTSVYTHTKGFKTRWRTPSSYYKYSAWLEAIRATGIDVIEVPDLEAGAMRVISLFNVTMHPEHKTLRRHIKPKICIPNKNPHVIALMCLSSAYGLGIGEDKAKRLIDKFGTLYKTIKATKEELCQIEGIGKLIAQKLFTLPRDKEAIKPKKVSNGGLSVVLGKGGV